MALVITRGARESLVVDHILTGDRFLMQFVPRMSPEGELDLRLVLVDEAKKFHFVRSELIYPEPTARSEIKRQRALLALGVQHGSV